MRVCRSLLLWTMPRCRPPTTTRLRASSASTQTPARELESLRVELAELDDLYYNKATPRRSDAEYDALKARALALEGAQGELSRTVGAKRSGQLRAAAPHLRRMLSLENLKRKDDEAAEACVKRWLTKARKAVTKNGGEPAREVVAEPKLDGLSVALRYEAHTGVLASAATRGDGTQGDDVTANAAGVRGVVLRLDPAPAVDVEVRGEVMMSRSTFEALRRKQQRASEEATLTTPRNAAAGSLRQLDAAVTAARNLTFYAHELATSEDDDDVSTSSYWSSTRPRLEQWGFACAGPAVCCASAAELVAYYEAQREAREAMDYEIDGVVYKLDSHTARSAAGATAKAPRWAVAHKFDGDAAVGATTLLEVAVSVGKRGALTPVASLEPVAVGDVTVSSATLHNAATVRDTLRGHRPGDTVLVRRAGDVIPQIVPSSSGEAGSFADWRLPAACPSCGTATVRADPEDDDSRYCPAAFACPAQARARLSHFFARGAMDLGAGVGKKKLEQLVEAGLVRDAADLLSFGLPQRREEDLAALKKLPGWAKTSAAKFLDALERRRTTPVPFARFLFALGAPRIGKTAAEKLAADIASWDDFWAALRGDDGDALRERTRLADLKGVGPAAIDALRDFASDPQEHDVAQRAAALLTLDFS